MQFINQLIPRGSHLKQLVCGLLLVYAFLPAFTRAQELSNQPAFEELAGKASSARDAGRTEDAIRYYQRALAQRPDWEEGWWYLGTLNYDADHHAEAIAAFEKLVTLNPKIGPAWAFLGLSEFETKDFERSLDHLQKADELGYNDLPVVRVARYHLALLFNLNGSFEKCTDLLFGEFGEGNIPDQAKVALGMALLRVPLLPTEVDPSKDALIRAAGETAVLVAHQKNDEAFRSFEQMLHEYPATPFLHYAYGVALTNASKTLEAESQLREETKISPESALPYIQLASIYLQLRRSDDALSTARRAVELAPRSASTHDALAQVLRAMGKSAQSDKESQAAHQLSTQRPEVDSALARAYRRGLTSSQAAPSKGERASADGPKGSAQANSSEFDELARQAGTAQRNNQPNEAISYYQRALKIRPQWEEGWRYLGILFYMTGRYGEAVRAFQNSVTLDEKHPEAWTLLGLSEFETRQYDNSLIHLQRGEKMGFGGSPAAVRIAKYHLALLLNLKSEFAQSTDLLTEEARRGSADEKIKTALGLGLLRIPKLPDQLDSARSLLVREVGEVATLLAQARYDEAFLQFDRILAEYPNTPYLHLAYGVALASISRYDEAEVQLREETRITPDSALPHLRMASIALRLHRPQDALRSAQRALQLSPESAESHYILGRSFLEVGNTADSIRALETARRLAANSPAVHFSLARAYAKAKRPEDAERERAIFVRLNTQSQSGESIRVSQAPTRAADPAEFNPSQR
jgi:tetratricopeptide (TPR) repeat protein